MTTQTAKAPAMLSVKKSFNLTEFFLRWEWILVIFLIVSVAIMSSLSPYFLNTRNLAEMSFNFLERGVMTLPMAFAIIATGGVDLSVASNLAMTSAILGRLYAGGMGIWEATIIALIVGALAGLFNALLITRIKLPPLAATLGTYTLYRGIAWLLMEDSGITGFPASFTVIGQGYIPGTLIPIPLMIFIILAIPFGLVLHYTTFGRFTYAIGNNREACRYAGVNINRILLVIFTASGLLAALAGVMMTARFGSVRGDMALGAEMDVITAVVLGGVDINGGTGSLPGVILALFLLGIVKYGMNLLNVAPQMQIIVTGFLLIIAIVLPFLMRSLTAPHAELDAARKARETRQRLMWGSALALLLVVGVLFSASSCGGGAAEQAAQGGSSGSTEASLPTAIVIPPTNTPKAAPPTPTPRPTHTPTPAGATSSESAGTPVAPPKPEVEMIDIPAGKFIMGSSGGNPNESPAHEVDLPAYAIDKFETTNAEFEQFVKATNYQTDLEKSGAKKTWRTFYTEDKANHPVVKVTYADAKAYCTWMDKRLPTEAEWEKAARGAEQLTYPWGKLWDTGVANIKASGLRGTAAVGSFPKGASPYGVEDMAGNVWEWTDSPFIAYPGSAYKDPQYREEAKVTRGGGWFDDQKQVQTTTRNGAFPESANDDLGFRCVKDNK